MKRQCIILISRVIVGAPFGNKTSGDTERTGYGSVYKCSSNSQSNPCQVITIDNSSKYFLHSL